MASSDIREKILDAAFAIVESEGVTAMTQPRIAKRAGVRQSHLTYYFPRKSDLLIDVLQHSHRRAAERPRDETEDVYTNIARLMFNPQRMRFFLNVLVEASAKPTLRAVLAAHFDDFRRSLASRFDVSPDSPALTAFIDRIRGMGMRCLAEPDGTPPPLSALRAMAHEYGLEDKGKNRQGHTEQPGSHRGAGT